jgi:hypothetical protein
MSNPRTLLDLLSRAALGSPEKGLIIQDNKAEGPPSRITYYQLYREAKVA